MAPRAQPACPLCPGPPCVSLPLHTPIAGNSLLPTVDSCLPAPAPDFPPETPLIPPPPRVTPAGLGPAACSPRNPLSSEFPPAVLAQPGGSSSSQWCSRGPRGQPGPCQDPGERANMQAGRRGCVREQPFTGQAGCASLPPRTPVSPPEEPLLQLTRPGVLAATGVTEPAHWVGCGLGAPSSSTHPASPAPGSSPTGPSAVRAPGTPARPRGGKQLLLLVRKALFSCSGRRPTLDAPAFAGPAVARRNLITLFSCFRFCFLIKK